MGYFELLEKKFIKQKEFFISVENYMRKKVEIKIERNYRLSQLLNLLTKKELDDIRVRLGIEGISSLSKQQLADSLAFSIRRKLREIIVNIGVDEFRFLEDILKGGGHTFLNEGDALKVRSLMEWGIIFAGSTEIEGALNQICIIPGELREDISDILKDKDFMEERGKRDIWTRLVQGLLYYYGVLDAFELNYFAEMFLNEDLDSEFFGYIYNNTGNGKMVEHIGLLFYDCRVVDPEGLYKFVNLNKGIDYKKLTLEDILEAGDRGYTEWKQYDSRYYDYLVYRFKIKEEEAFNLIEYLKLMFMNNYVESSYEYIKTYFQNLDNVTIKEIQSFMQEVGNNNINWALKGYTPFEFKNIEPMERESSVIYQLRVEIKGIKPPIWRKLQVSSDTTLMELHNMIQGAFNWSGKYRYEFTVHGDKLGTDTMDLSGKSKSDLRTKLHAYNLKEKDKFCYLYNFDSPWEYTVVIEKILEREEQRRYPLCTGGKRNAPPEDIGGVQEYYEFLEKVNSLENTGDSKYSDLIKKDYDSEEFDQVKVTRVIRRVQR